MSAPSVNSASGSASLSDKQPFDNEKRSRVTTEFRKVDVAAQLSSQDTVDPQNALRVR